MRRDKQGKLHRAVIGGIVLAVAAGGWYSVGLYRNKKAVEAMIAERRRQEAQAQAERAEKIEEAREGRLFAGPEEGIVTYQGKTYCRNTAVKPILCIGVDRSGSMTETTLSGDGGQADGIFLLAQDTARNQIKILLIPRDTITPIMKTDISWSDKNGTELGMDLDHLSLSYAYGDGRQKSCEYTVQAVSELLEGFPIPYYMAADTSVISALNDAVGGVTVTVPTLGMDQADPAFVFGEKVTLQGAQAERFVRYRDTTIDNSAIHRMDQQKAYISGFFEAVRQTSKSNGNIISDLFDLTQDYMVTNMPKDQYLKVALDALQGSGFSDDSFCFAPGSGTATETYDEYYVDQDALDQVILQLFYSEQ